jgi:hypothetical protein
MVLYAKSVIEFHQAHPLDMIVLVVDPWSLDMIVLMVANLIFEIASVYLHIKSLKMLTTQIYQPPAVHLKLQHIDRHCLQCGPQRSTAN